MIDGGVIITALIGIATTFASAFATWFFARKKYNSEVDNNLIKNMKESLDFYKQLSDDNRTRLDKSLERSEALETEVRELRQQVMTLMSTICTDLTCQLRKIEYESILNKKKLNKDEKNS